MEDYELISLVNNQNTTVTNNAAARSINSSDDQAETLQEKLEI